MGKMTKEEKYRREGMAYALRIAEAQGIEGLKEELRMRNVSHAPLALPREAIDEWMHNTRCNMIDTLTILGAMVLHDEYGFGEARLNRYIERFNSKAECLMDEMCSWQDNITALEEECGIKLQIRANDTDVKVVKRV